MRTPEQECHAPGPERVELRTRPGRKSIEFAERWLAHPGLPLALALAGVVVMLPALKAGLAMDDLVQRAVELEPRQLDPRIRQTGIALESGTFSSVLSDLFGFGHHPESVSLARDYGLLPWWSKEHMKAALWRPLTAFTHWIEYRLYPDRPALMHAQNIAWFAAVVWLAALAYRDLIRPQWAAGLAAVFFLLDENTYFPVMFVANRGFVIALCFGLLCLHAHHRWRRTGSPFAGALSLLALAASLLANEAGASTLAFLFAYALWLEKPSGGEPEAMGAGSTAPAADAPVKASISRVLPAVLSIIPAVLVVSMWRLVYRTLGFGVVNVGAYIDPVLEPGRFSAQVGWRATALLAGQITGIPPDATMTLSPALRTLLFGLGCGALAGFILLSVSLLRRDRVARFWFSVMLLAAVPAATVVPLSKNMGFMAVGAFGFIACFVAGLAKGRQVFPRHPAYRTVFFAAAGLLVLAHVPRAVLGRIAATQAAPLVFQALERLGEVGAGPTLEGRNVIVLNAPCQLAMFVAPFARAYHGEAVPRSLRCLLPACTSFDIERRDAETLVVRTAGEDIFSCGDLGFVHSAYAFNATDRLLGRNRFTRGERVRLRELTVEVVDTDSRGLPSRLAFHFPTALESLPARWLYFDWPSGSYRPLALPFIGEHIRLAGPRPQRLPDLARRAWQAANWTH